MAYLYLFFFVLDNGISYSGVKYLVEQAATISNNRKSRIELIFEGNKGLNPQTAAELMQIASGSSLLTLQLGNIILLPPGPAPPPPLPVSNSRIEVVAVGDTFVKVGLIPKKPSEVFYLTQNGVETSRSIQADTSGLFFIDDLLFGCEYLVHTNEAQERVPFETKPGEGPTILEASENENKSIILRWAKSKYSNISRYIILLETDTSTEEYASPKDSTEYVLCNKMIGVLYRIRMKVFLDGCKSVCGQEFTMSLRCPDLENVMCFGATSTSIGLSWDRIPLNGVRYLVKLYLLYMDGEIDEISSTETTVPMHVWRGLSGDTTYRVEVLAVVNVSRSKPYTKEFTTLKMNVHTYVNMPYLTYPLALTFVYRTMSKNSAQKTLSIGSRFTWTLARL